MNSGSGGLRECQAQRAATACCFQLAPCSLNTAAVRWLIDRSLRFQPRLMGHNGRLSKLGVLSADVLMWIVSKLYSVKRNHSHFAMLVLLLLLSANHWNSKAMLSDLLFLSIHFLVLASGVAGVNRSGHRLRGHQLIALHTLTPRGSIQYPTHLMCMVLDCLFAQ